MLRSYLKSYCDKSTVHGVVYIGHSRTKIVEKIFWIISLIISLIFTGSWLFELVAKLARTPIIVSLDDTPIHVTEIYFPSMSICPGMSYLVDGVDYNQFVDEIKSGKVDLRNFTELELQRLQVISLATKDDFLSQFNVSISTENFIDRLEDFLNFYGESFKGRSTHYQDHGNWTKRFHINFTQVIGENGFCFTFNFPKSEKFFNVKELSSDFNYNKSVATRTYPNIRDNATHIYPLKTSSADLGIVGDIQKRRSFYINKKRVEFISANIEDGYHLTFHDPFDVISRESPNYFAILNRTSLFTIYPNKFDYDESISSYLPEQRNCFLPNEKLLKFFKVYSRINCDHECLANLTLIACKCVQFWMIRDEKTRICGLEDSKCFKKIEENFPRSRSQCNCLESCRRLHYDVQMKIIDFNVETFKCASLEVKFSDDLFYQLIFKTPYSFVEIIAFTGGLLGLFAGLSALSVIEVIYYFSVRVLMNFSRSSSKVYPFRSDNNSQITRSFFRNFVENSSVHSFHYISTEDKFLKKLFWIFAFAFSIFGFYSMSTSSYQRFSSNVVSVQQDSCPTTINEIPFPAITIIGDFEHSYQEFMTDFYNRFFYPWKACKDCKVRLFTLQTMVEMFVCEDEPEYELDKKRFNYSMNSEFFDMLINITSSKQKLWFNERNATWQGDANPKYVETLSSSGIGFTYNTFDADEVFNRNIVSEDFFRIQSEKNVKSRDSVPWRSLLSINNDFTISLTNHSHLINNIDLNDRCISAAFSVHSSNESPLNFQYKKFTKILFGHSMEVLIKPEVIRSDDSIEELDLIYRKCYLKNEFQLKYFKHYTKSQCDMEVLSEITYKKCGCVPFNYIRNKTMEICDVSRWPCANRQKKYVHDGKDNTEFSRHCLPLCDSISYDTELITTRIDKSHNKNFMSEVTLSFEFKDSEVIVLKRYRQFPTTDFLSSIGGLLGLFAGVSILTVLETFHLLLIRPLTDALRRAV